MTCYEKIRVDFLFRYLHLYIKNYIDNIQVYY